MFIEGSLIKALLVLISAIAFAGSALVAWDFSGFDPNHYPVTQFDPAVQPAGWAFSIWSVIYVALIAHAAFGLFQHKEDQVWDAGRSSVFASLFVGTLWLPVAAVSPVWATVLIWVMLVFGLLSLYQTQRATPAWHAGWPVGLYVGWLTAASFVSIGLLLAGYGILSEPAAAILSLLLATVFSLFDQYQLRHWTYGAAVVWGFAAISAKNAETQSTISVLAAAAALSVLGLTMANVVSKKHP